MLTNREKIALIEEIEERLGINLQREQLEYIFNKNKKISFVSPRRYGKDTMAAVRVVLNSLATSNRRTIIFAHGEMAVRQSLELIASVAGPLMDSKKVCHPSRITFNNGSDIQVINGKNIEQMRGRRADEIIIQDAFMNNSSTLYTLVNCALSLVVHNDDYSVSLIGTPNAISASFLHNISTSESWDTTIIRLNDIQRENTL